MPRKVPGIDPGIGERPMSDASQARHRAARAAGSPVTRTHRSADPSRPGPTLTVMTPLPN